MTQVLELGAVGRLFPGGGVYNKVWDFNPPASPRTVFCCQTILTAKTTTSDAQSPALEHDAPVVCCVVTPRFFVVGNDR